MYAPIRVGWPLLWLLLGTALAQPAAPPKPAAAPADHRQQISALEARVAALKDDVFRARARLTVLDAAVRSSAIAGAWIEVVHRNEMGSSFTLEKVAYRLDGTPIFERVATEGALDDETAIPIHAEAIVPGDHTLDVLMIYRGRGFGVFSYLRSYVFTLRSSHTFNIGEGKRITVEAVGYEKGGATRSLEDRPDIRFEDTIDDLGPESGG